MVFDIEESLLPASSVLSSTWFYVALLILLLVLSYRTKPRNMPPGPRGFPVFGYGPYLFTDLGPAYLKVSEKYGPVSSFFQGPYLTLLLSDYESIQEALVKHGDVFSGRPVEIMAKVKPIGPTEVKTITLSEGKFWQEHRKFAINAFKDAGVGKSSLEPLILMEISRFMKEMEQAKQSSSDSSVEFAPMINRSVTNNIWTVLTGNQVDQESKLFRQFKDAVLDTTRKFSTNNPEYAYPFLAHIPVLNQILGSASVLKYQQLFKTILEPYVEKHRKDYQADLKQNYLDSYFTEQNKRNVDRDDPDEIFNDTNIFSTMGSVFIAGSLTVTDTMSWGLIYLMLHQDIQRKVQKEIDDVIGPNRTPTYEDRLLMPYTEATIWEIHRKGCILGTGPPRSTMADVEFRGYSIPKHTMVVTNTWAVHHDKRFFPDPFTFRPERFINEQGQFVKDDHVIPFSIGKRTCFGEPLARTEIFLYLVTMLQKYTFTIPDGQYPSFETAGRIFRPTQPYRVKVTKRE